jgi:hypothetical protein
MNTKQVGDETEAKIMAALIAEGCTISVLFGDNESYDLVLDTGATLERVQCKPGWIEDDVVRFKTAKQDNVRRRCRTDRLRRRDRRVRRQVS